MSDEKNINETVDFERRGVNARALAWIAALIISGAVLMHFFLYLLYLDFTNPDAQRERSTGSFVEKQEPQVFVPRLQVNPALEINEWRERENQRLNNYGWVDREHGVVHIPIERAMDKVLKNGLPKPNQTNQTLAEK